MDPAGMTETIPVTHKTRSACVQRHALQGQETVSLSENTPATVRDLVEMIEG
jgi:hypothetical protein